MIIQMHNYDNCVKIGAYVYVDKHGTLYKRKSKNRTLVGIVLNIGEDSINVNIEPAYIKIKKQRKCSN